MAIHRAGEWFPELASGDVTVTVVGRRRRSRCTLFTLALQAGTEGRRVVVKVRRHSPPDGAGSGATGPGRPSLLPPDARPLPDPARREYEGLQLVADMVRGQGDPALSVVRPLAWLPGAGAIVMDEVAGETLRRRLVDETRLRGPLRSPPTGPGAWQAAGRWLSLLHRAPTDLPLVARNEQRAGIEVLCGEFGRYLRTTTGSASVADRLAAASAAGLRDALPPRLPLAPGHGDFAARNVFADDDGRVTVVDLLPRWRVPPLEDVCRFVVGLRLLALQAVTRGAAIPAGRLDDVERAFVTAYFAPDPVPWRAHHAYTALVLMDKWAALAHAATRSRAVRVRAALSRRQFEREATRLADLLEGETRAGPTRPDPDVGARP